MDLFGACRKGDIARVRQAVADGADVRKVVDKSRSNYTPLHYACEYVACNPTYRIMIRYAHEIFGSLISGHCTKGLPCL